MIQSAPLPSRSRFRFTVDEYEEMIEHGILTENDRVELIHGEILEKMSIGADHSGCSKSIIRAVRRLPDDKVVVGVQDPIRLDDSEPEPDISLMRFRADFYRKSIPQPKDILLLVEISDSSLLDDREVKGPMYAAAQVLEYWIANLIDECLEVYRSPQPDGTYAEQLILHRGDKVRMLAFPDIEFDVAEFI